MGLGGMVPAPQKWLELTSHFCNFELTDMDDLDDLDEGMETLSEVSSEEVNTMCLPTTNYLVLTLYSMRRC